MVRHWLRTTLNSIARSLGNTEFFLEFCNLKFLFFLLIISWNWLATRSYTLSPGCAAKKMHSTLGDPRRSRSARWRCYTPLLLPRRAHPVAACRPHPIRELRCLAAPRTSQIGSPPSPSPLHRAPLPFHDFQSTASSRRRVKGHFRTSSRRRCVARSARRAPARCARRMSSPRKDVTAPHAALLNSPPPPSTPPPRLPVDQRWPLRSDQVHEIAFHLC